MLEYEHGLNLERLRERRGNTTSWEGMVPAGVADVIKRPVPERLLARAA
jgi:hypothetical protein